MIRSYLKIAWRNLRKNKLYTLINIVGLTVGIASCLLIGVYIKHELSYDRFNTNADRIIRISMDYSTGGANPQKTAVSGNKAGPQLKRNFPSVVDFVRMRKLGGVITFNDRVFHERNVVYADASLFKIFSYKLSDGDASSALNTADKIIITQTAAKKYFDNDNPIGKTLKVDDKSYIISAVAADAPTNSQIKFDFIISYHALGASKNESWWNANDITYLLLHSGNQLPQLQKQVTVYMQTVSKGELKMDGSSYLTYHLQPLTSVHLHSNLENELEPNGSITYIYIMVIVAVLILVIACVNYVNLSIAQSTGRGAEIGIRKVLGAARQQLFNQFIGESLLVTLIAVILAIGVAALVLPLFNEVSGKELTAVSLLDPAILGCLLVLAFIIGLAAGAYPAVLLSNVKLVKILKSGFSFTSGQSVRKPLIVFQFVISIFLIVTTVIILQQLSFIRNKDIGYNKSNVVVLPIAYAMIPQVDAIKKVIANIPGVQSVAAANNEPVNVGWGDGISTKDGKSLTVNALPMDEDFIKTMQIKIVAGSDFTHSDVLQIDTTNKGKNFRYSFMLNETAARALGFTPEQAIGKEISKNSPGTIKAVVKDFNYKSFHQEIGPLLIFLDHFQTGDIFVRINGDHTQDIIASLQKIWKDRNPGRPFEYKFLDDDYDALYKTEQRTAGVFTTFSVLAILLACLGLFAVTAYTVVQRTKEIGIRKVLGATVSGVVLLIAKDFLVLVVIASVIASPIAWYLANGWLRDFAYRITIHWWIFAAAGVACLVVAAITVSFQAIKAALANPVNSLRSE
jgi:putative ABC transport system permease protein